MAARVCDASLNWETQKLVVAERAAQIDLDLFGVDMEMDGPVAAFQVKKAKNECCVTYRLYSLDSPPRLLRTIAGGSSFSAADRDLDGRIEIWTDDAAAVDALDDIFAAEIEYLPVYVLRFEHGRVLDASTEFQSYFDDVVKAIRAEFNPDSLHEFKLSDGRLKGELTSDFSRLHRLRVAKIQVLEIVWAYLYSGRDQQAWQSLAELWPDADAERIRLAIIKARSSGILAQLDGVSTGSPGQRKSPPRIYDQSDVTSAKAIHMWRFPLSSQADQFLFDAEVILDLVIDSAGKVYSYKVFGDEGKVDEGFLSAVKYWKFIPAMKEGHSVASRLRLITSVRR